MSSEYQTLSVIQVPVNKGTISAEVVSNGTEICYRLETFSDAVHLYHKGPMAGKRPVVTFHDLTDVATGTMPTVKFRDQVAKLAVFLLTTHSE